MPPADGPATAAPPARRIGTALGRHLLIELYGCDGRFLSSIETVRSAMLAAAAATGATVVDSLFHSFDPGPGASPSQALGVSGVVVIMESHLAIHTWPEHGCASVDIYTCGRHVDPWKAYPVLNEKLASRRMSAIELPRALIL